MTVRKQSQKFKAEVYVFKENSLYLLNANQDRT